MSRKILLIVHQVRSDPGRVARKLVDRGFALDIRRVALGDPLPDTLTEHAGAVIFGGPMSANDDTNLPTIKAELDWLDIPLREEKPFLGICLGAQLLARHLGADVGPHPHGWHEIGYYPIRATEVGCGLFPREQYFYQWHGEGFGLPAGAELLAEGEYFPNQAFRHGRALAVQFHPEVTREMMHRWTAKATHRMVLPGAQPRQAHLEGHTEHDAGVEVWLDGFLDYWLGLEAAAGDCADRRADAVSLVDAAD
ncbi:MAG: hypothetical protein QF893_17360 [Alphaproteobacteria bacterium]|jgi:GMP synthase (glutamine-hydrolysing)|nr:hypothetical protein [Alphaproteobacteria bacterium]